MRDSVRRTYSKLLGQEEEPTLYEEVTGICPSLSMKQRIIGFAVCLGLGLICCIMSLFSIPSIVLHPSSFAIPYTLGNILAVSATAFLIGPLRQLRACLNPTRIIASIVFVLALVLTIVAAFVLQSEILVLLAVIIQFCALTWYALSYIPFARAICKNCLSSIVSI